MAPYYTASTDEWYIEVAKGFHVDFTLTDVKVSCIEIEVRGYLNVKEIFGPPIGGVRGVGAHLVSPPSQHF